MNSYELGRASVVPASVLDEPEFLEWANEKVSQMPATDLAWSWYTTMLCGPASWYLHCLVCKRGEYDTIADVARAYVVYRDAIKEDAE